MSTEDVLMGETFSVGDSGSVGVPLVTSGIGERLGRYMTTVSRLSEIFLKFLKNKTCS